MARLLAIDWDRLEARMIVARTQGDSIQIDHIATASLELDPQESNLTGLEEQLARALGRQRFPRCQALTAIGRSLVELRVLQLPPAPDDELPELVRFQALREFSALEEDSPLDYVPLDDAAAEAGEVMAASISSELAGQVRGALTTAGHEVSRAILRPCAAASLAMRRCERARGGVTLVIAQLADSAELAIAKDGRVVFTRSFRLPPDWHPGESGEPLLGEVRRSIAAAQNQLSGSLVEHIVFFGTPSEHNSICQRLKERTDLDVELLDPFQGVRPAGARPEQPERFAALLGMLHDEVADVRPAIDFYNPRRKPKPESKQRLYSLLGATAATIVLAVAGLIYWQFHQLNQDIVDLKATYRDIENENKRLRPAADIAQQLDLWKESDRNWLEEFRRLSRSNSLTAEDFRIESLLATALVGDRGMIRITGRARNQESSSTLQKDLRDETHDVEVGRSSLTEDDLRYPHQFITVIRLSESIPVVPPVTETPPTDEPQAGESADESAEDPAEESAEDPAEESAEEPAEGPAAVPAATSEVDDRQAGV